MTKKILILRRRPEILLLLLLGVLPLLWFKPGYITAKGDDFPFWLNPHETQEAEFYLWSMDSLGNANIGASSILHGFLWWSLLYLGLDVGFIQIIIQIFLFMGGSLAAYYLSNVVYPDSRLTPFVTSVFYMFNFFTLQSRLNLGFIFTYAFLPLLMALLINFVDASLHQSEEKANKNMIYLAIISSIAFSLINVNPANIIITLLVLALIPLYYMITQRNQMRQLILSILKLTGLAIPLNIWWVLPIFNLYLWSSSEFIPEVNVLAWSWTHARASFLNSFWLNGQWSWRPEYVPYINSYANPILIILTFLPFFTAATALLFKTDKRGFNAYLMLAVLIFLFLAKGIHEPLSQLNLLFYTYVPGMNMFREAATKFTMALMPFLALLVGYAVNHLAKIKLPKLVPFVPTKTLVATFFIIAFIVSAYPLITNPIETKTSQIPFSSYVKIPKYWYAAADWINHQPEYYVLITPPDDFYMMPYTWGYFGSEGWLNVFFQKPIITYDFGYAIKKDVRATLQDLYDTIDYNRTNEFRALLDVLNVRYILQRNDVQYNFTGRNIISPNEMHAFLTQQPYIRLAQKFGQLDIYEYDEPKPYIYTLSPTTLKQTSVKIENITLLQRSWNFTSITDVEEWQNATQPNQWQINYTITQDGTTLKAELWNSTSGWKTINSPLIPALYGYVYQIQSDIKGQNAHQVHIKIGEYDTDKNIITEKYLTFVNDGTFNWIRTTFNFEPTYQSTKYVQIQVWHGHETDKPLPNIIWIDNVQIHGYTIRLNTTGLDLLFQNTTQNQPATALNYTKVNPTKITATINATQPFILAISEALDQSWKANVNGKQIENVPLYLGLKGFQINQTGLFEVTIEYEPQKWFYYSAIISGITFLACLTYLTYNYTKNKNIWKANQNNEL